MTGVGGRPRAAPPRPAAFAPVRPPAPGRSEPGARQRRSAVMELQDLLPNVRNLPVLPHIRDLAIAYALAFVIG